jgi:hypothetical protein
MSLDINFFDFLLNVHMLYLFIPCSNGNVAKSMNITYNTVLKDKENPGNYVRQRLISIS